MPENTKRLAEFAAALNFRDVPSAIVLETKRALLDSLGCAVAGHATPSGQMLTKLARRLGGPGEATIIGTRDKVACTHAAMANGQLINALDFDAGSTGHDTAAVVAAALALAETSGASGADLIAAIALGHEVATRLKSAEQPIWGPVPDGAIGARMETAEIFGFSSGTLAVAVVAGRLLKLDAEKMRNAIGIAAWICPPNANRRFIDISSPIRNTRYAALWRVAEAGVTSALMAEMGYTGDVEALDAENGFFKYMGNREWDADRVSRDLGSAWLHKIAYKSYPSHYPTHGAKDLFEEIIQENSLQPDEIQKITQRIWPLYKYGMMQNNRLETLEDFLFCLPYQLACAAYRIDPTRWLDLEVRNDPRLRAFMGRVEFVVDCDERAFAQAKLANPAANLVGAEVVARGTTFAKESLYRRGMSFPEQFRASDETLIAKFQGNVSRTLDPKAAERAAGALFELEHLPSCGDLLALLAP